MINEAQVVKSGFVARWMLVWDGDLVADRKNAEKKLVLSRISDGFRACSTSDAEVAFKNGESPVTQDWDHAEDFPEFTLAVPIQVLAFMTNTPGIVCRNSGSEQGGWSNYFNEDLTPEFWEWAIISLDGEEVLMSEPKPFHLELMIKN